MTKAIGTPCNYEEAHVMNALAANIDTIKTLDTRALV